MNKKEEEAAQKQSSGDNSLQHASESGLKSTPA